MKSPAVSEGRELAAQAIEAEARAYEAQFGKTGPGGEAAAVLWMAAEIARGQSDEELVTPEQFAQYKAEAEPARIVPPPEGRCMVCDEPMVDHRPVRYVLRAWLKHKLLQRL